MADFQFEVGLSDERENILIEKLRAFNREHAPSTTSPPIEQQALQIFAMDEHGEMIGGLIGRTNAIRSWLEITVLWVDTIHLGFGLGTRLVQTAEEEARARGCRFARLATGKYQAPDFYVKCGYTLYGQLEDCPPGETVFYFRKKP